MFFILVTSLLDTALTLSGEILSWSLLGVEGFSSPSLVSVYLTKHCLRPILKISLVPLL